MFKIVFSVFLMNALCFGQNYDMRVNLKNGSNVSFPVSNIQRIVFTGLTDVKDFSGIKNLIKSFNVMQNYPNPFNPSTTITYQIAKPSGIKVSVYDINGQLVKQILNEFQMEGEHHVLWDGTDQKNTMVTSGVYVYVVSADNSIISKQMLLIK